MQDDLGNLGVNALLRQFAVQIFTDCATRSERRGVRRLKALAGRNITYGLRPVLFRGSDFAWRQLMSVMALERTGRKNSDACWETFTIAFCSLCRHLLFSKSNRGRKGGSSGAFATTLLQLQNGQISPENLDGNTILALIDRVKGNTNGLKRRLVERGINVDQMFDGTFGAFRADYARNVRWDAERCVFRTGPVRSPEWYAEAETGLLKLIRRLQSPPWDGAGPVTLILPAPAQTELGPHHTLVGFHAANLAHLYHEESKYTDAASWYRRAWLIFIAEPAIGTEFRTTLLEAIALDLCNCSRGQPLACLPAHSGARIYRGLLPIPSSR